MLLLKSLLCNVLSLPLCNSHTLLPVLSSIFKGFFLTAHLNVLAILHKADENERLMSILNNEALASSFTMTLIIYHEPRYDKNVLP